MRQVQNSQTTAHCAPAEVCNPHEKDQKKWTEDLGNPHAIKVAAKLVTIIGTRGCKNARYGGATARQSFYHATGHRHHHHQHHHHNFHH